MKMQSDIMDSELGRGGSPNGNGVAIHALNLSYESWVYVFSLSVKNSIGISKFNKVNARGTNSSRKARI